jgi:hypothetical protein
VAAHFEGGAGDEGTSDLPPGVFDMMAGDDKHPAWSNYPTRKAAIAAASDAYLAWAKAAILMTAHRHLED